MKKIVIVNSSPRRQGNCETLCDIFAHEVLTNGHCEVGRINLNDKAFGYYGEEQADDGFESVVNELAQADTIVLATPLYFYNMSGQLKVFIDRLLPYFPRLADKDFYFILTAATPKQSMELAADSLTAFTDSLPGACVKEIFYCPNVSRKGEAANHEVAELIRNTARNL